jgi:hypothetical protein
VERKIHRISKEISCVENISLPLSHAPPLPSLSLSLLCGSLKGHVGAKVNSTTARRRAAGIPDLI